MSESYNLLALNPSALLLYCYITKKYLKSLNIYDNKTYSLTNMFTYILRNCLIQPRGWFLALAHLLLSTSGALG